MLRVTNGATMVDAGAARTTALFPYASAQEFPWYVADWGTLTVNPMAREGYALQRGDVLDFAVRFVGGSHCLNQDLQDVAIFGIRDDGPILIGSDGK